MSRLHSSRRGARRPSAWAIAAGLVLGVACTGASEEESSSETESGGAEPLAPSFVELESQHIVVSSRETMNITLAVADLRPDTEVELDGRGSLPGASAPAWLDAVAGELHVPLAGALITGRHTLALRHEVGGELLRSEPITLDVEPSELGPLVASLDPDPAGSGDALVAHGQGVDVALALFDGANERAVIRAGAWGKPGFVLELPGLAPAPGAGAGVAGWGLVDVAIASPPDERWVVVSWLDAAREQAFARIVAIDGPGDPLAEPGPVLPLWSLDDPEQAASLGPHELQRIHALALLERTVVLGVEARRDVEQPSPGDFMLASRYLAASGDPSAPAVLRGSGGRDLELADEGRGWTGGFAGAKLDVRVDLAFARRLQLANNGLAQLEPELDPQAGLMPATRPWWRSADAAIGGRHVFSLELELDEGTARVQVQRYERWRAPEEGDEGDAGDAGDVGDEGDAGDEGEGEDAPPSGVGAQWIELPGIPSAAPSLTLVDGVLTLLVPLGADAEVVALRSTGAQTVLEPVAELRCEAIGVASPGDDGVGDTLPLACLRSGELWLGALGDN